MAIKDIPINKFIAMSMVVGLSSLLIPGRKVFNYDRCWYCAEGNKEEHICYRNI